MAAFGASDLLPSVPARGGLLNWKPTLGPDDGDYFSCPEANPHDHRDDRQGWVDSGPSRFARPEMPEL
jgi:hypothetical protein